MGAAYEGNGEMLLSLLLQGGLYQGKVIVLNPVLKETVRDLNLELIVLDRNRFNRPYPGLEALGIDFFFNG